MLSNKNIKTLMKCQYELPSAGSRYSNTPAETVVGRMCQARYMGTYVIGKIIKHNQKDSVCCIETKFYGTIKAKASRIRMLDKADD